MLDFIIQRQLDIRKAENHMLQTPNGGMQITYDQCADAAICPGCGQPPMFCEFDGTAAIYICLNDDCDFYMPEPI